MSDTCFNSVTQKNRLIDIVDDEWIADYLSDDEIELPKESDRLTRNEEPIDGDDDNGIISEDDQWNDLGIDFFTTVND
eukprot:CAMPEP_0182419108 /NCGR_PEP_ID=MMETSP1167-20130531/3511_1 /TAXON_ID=2988 /ORGANISM="Mallomonas Sp, Strain CCMP3275" /LENGTH=77 /DNA_ID=CAMNT_0024593743 /DNA_START=218 /DNA_END=451 /DNA_ORIENTATION=+